MLLPNRLPVVLRLPAFQPLTAEIQIHLRAVKRLALEVEIGRSLQCAGFDAAKATDAEMDATTRRPGGTAARAVRCWPRGRGGRRGDDGGHGPELWG